MAFKNLRLAKINSANLLYFAIDKIDGSIEESNANKYLILAFTDENKDTVKKGMKNYGLK